MKTRRSLFCTLILCAAPSYDWIVREGGWRGRREAVREEDAKWFVECSTNDVDDETNQSREKHRLQPFTIP